MNEYKSPFREGRDIRHEEDPLPQEQQGLPSPTTVGSDRHHEMQQHPQQQVSWLETQQLRDTQAKMQQVSM